MKVRSYLLKPAPDVPNGNGNGHRVSLRLNLLNHPPRPLHARVPDESDVVATVR